MRYERVCRARLITLEIIHLFFEVIYYFRLQFAMKITSNKITENVDNATWMPTKPHNRIADNFV